MTDDLDSTEKHHGDVYAFRQFRLTPRGLTGVARRFDFAHGQNAWCNKMRLLPSKERTSVHRSPDPGCDCGYWAYHELATFTYDPDTVYSVVKLSGRVLVEQGGYRAERMEVVAISSRSQKNRDRIQTMIANDAEHMLSGIPVFENAESMLSEYPLTEGLVDSFTDRRFKRYPGDDAGTTLGTSKMMWYLMLKMLVAGLSALGIFAVSIPAGYFMSHIFEIESTSELLIGLGFVVFAGALSLILKSFGLALYGAIMLSAIMSGLMRSYSIWPWGRDPESFASVLADNLIIGSVFAAALALTYACMEIFVLQKEPRKNSRTNRA